MVNYLQHFWTLKPLFVPVLAFLIPITLVLDYSPDFESESKCAYVIAVMAILWLTEALPIPVTALVPICLFPLLGVATAADVSNSYIKDTTMLFLGGLIVAVALEESRLHIRISLCVMLIVGAQPLFLMAGLMATTWFLSMWISNTAATSMMIPIIEAVMQNMEHVRKGALGEVGLENDAYEESSGMSTGISTVDLSSDSDRSSDIPLKEPPVTFSPMPNGDGPVPKHFVGVPENNIDGDLSDVKSTNYTVTTQKINREESTEEPVSGSKELRRFAKGFALSVAYGANIGGIATLTGTPPNLVLKQEADKLYKTYSGSESEISFAKWIGFGFPLSLFTAFFGWLWLALVFLRCGCFKRSDPEQRRAINSTIRTHFKQLGRLSIREIQVLIIFVALVALWLFRAPPNISGWGNAGTLKKGYVSDSTPCILLSILLFLLPAEMPKVFCHAKDEKPSYTPLLDWKSVSQKLPWGVIVLLGGGFAIADVSKASGLSKWVGNELTVFSSMDSWIMNMIICFIVAGATEVTSNTATATLLMPILSELAIQTKTHPLYLMMSATVACSFAFMLPVATPPNAIVFSSGYLTIPDMALAGLPMNIIAVLCLTLAINTWGTSMFELDTFPEMFNQTISMTTS